MTPGGVILVVDDSDFCAEVLEIALSIAGHFTVVRAATADSARGRLAAGGCAALITDLHLGPATGLDLVRLIRAEGSRMPVIVVSGGPARESRQAAEEAGADAFFPKPFSPWAVRETLEVLLARP